MELNRIIISRVDKIGDVVLTLPLAGYLKNLFPDCYIFFLGKKYTRPVIDSCVHIDEFIDWDYLQELSSANRIKALKKLHADTIIHVFPDSRIAKATWQAGIPNRIGTSHRTYHWLYVNRKVKLSRRKSDLHEAQLNIELVKLFLNLPHNISLSEIPGLYGFTKTAKLNDEIRAHLKPDMYNVILHPKSKGSAREWGLDKYAELIRELPLEKYNIIVAGTDSEASEMEQLLKVYKNRIIDLTGKLSLSEYISLIASSDALIACSTGPLHIAAATGITAIGIYAPMKPIFPKRWAPLGLNATYLVKDGDCNKCKKLDYCECISNIPASDVIMKLNHSYHQKFCLHGA